MSLDLLKERFGHSVKKGADNKEKINEKLNDKFNSDGMENLKSLKYQHQEDLEEKERIIENLEIETSELANEVLALEKEKAIILDELNTAKWMENKVALSTKNMYEDKIRKIVDDFRINHVDDSKIIPLLTAVSRRKQGNQKLNYGNWLRIPENRYLEQINENIAKNIFEDTNALIDRAMGRINRVRTYAGDESTYTNNSSITFTGDGTFGNEGTGDYVDTGFDPIEHELYNGFTVSFWVRPDEIGDRMFALGVYGNGSNERFTFGIRSAGNLFIGIGSTRKQENAAHGMEVGQWYHWVFTYSGHTGTAAGVCDADCRWLRVYKNGQPVQISPEGDFEGGIYVSHNRDYAGRTGGHSLFLGGRNNRVRSGGAGYDNGWACGLDEVAIYNEMKDSDPADYTSGDVPSWVTETYNNGVPTDLTDQSGLVAYWRFEDNAVTDYSGQGNHGTLTTDDTGLPTFSSDTPGG